MEKANDKEHQDLINDMVHAKRKEVFEKIGELLVAPNADEREVDLLASYSISLSEKIQYKNKKITISEKRKVTSHFVMKPYELAVGPQTFTHYKNKFNRFYYDADELRILMEIESIDLVYCNWNGMLEYDDAFPSMMKTYCPTVIDQLFDKWWKKYGPELRKIAKAMGENLPKLRYEIDIDVIQPVGFTAMLVLKWK